MDFQTWNSIGDSGNTYTNTQGQCNIAADDNLAQAYSDTWVLAFDGTNYQGNILKITESDGQIDLNHTTRYDSTGKDIGDWKNQIQSFILYKQQPSWWNSITHVAPTHEQLFELHDVQVLVCEDENYLGDNRVFQGPYSCVKVANVGYTTNGRYMSGAYAISSLSTGPNAWLIIFDQPSMAGNFKKIPPNTPYPNLNEVERDDINGNKVGDWEDQINSFLIYNAEPEFWNTPYASPYIDHQTLFNLYPCPTSKESDDKITYEVEDSTYSITYPEFEEQSADQGSSVYKDDDTSDLPQTGWTKYHVHMEHDINLALNDTVEFDIYFDNGGSIIHIENFTWKSGGAFNVPSTVIKSVDVIAWYLGVTNSFETLGISDEAADDFVDVFNFVCNAFNTIANKVYQFTDNGGQFYFLPVICHTLNRICATVITPYGIPVYTGSSSDKNLYALNFDNGSFPAALGGSASSWAPKQDLTGGTYPFNQVTEYTYEDSKYRTWYQESSVSGSLGMFVSCKIDYEIDDDQKDDHIIILMGFKIPDSDQTAPVMTFAQATVQFTDGSNSNVMTPAFNSGSGTQYYSTDIINSVYQFITSSLTGITMSDSQEGRKYLADIAQANMQAIVQCMSYQPS